MSKKTATPWQPRSVSLIPVEEKLSAYDRLYALALRFQADWERTGEMDDDAYADAVEAVVSLLGPGVWKVRGGK